jgi:hypothetical protein
MQDTITRILNIEQPITNVEVLHDKIQYLISIIQQGIIKL